MLVMLANSVSDAVLEILVCEDVARESSVFVLAIVLLERLLGIAVRAVDKFSVADFVSDVVRASVDKDGSMVVEKLGCVIEVITVTDPPIVRSEFAVVKSIVS